MHAYVNDVANCHRRMTHGPNPHAPVTSWIAWEVRQRHAVRQRGIKAAHDGVHRTGYRYPELMWSVVKSGGRTKLLISTDDRCAQEPGVASKEVDLSFGRCP